MRQNRQPTDRSGFTAVEMLVVLAITGILATLGIPWIQNILHRSKMQGLTANTTTILRVARSESIKRNVTTIVRYDPDRREFLAFADIDGVNVGEGPDGVFNPIDGEPVGTTDYLVGGRFPLPTGIEIQAPDGWDAFDDLTTVSPPDGDEQVAVFAPDGSIADIGAFRMGDARGNFFEVRIEPQATARIQVRKYDEGADDWLEHRENGQPWKWS